jgi:hypothetical protein
MDVDRLLELQIELQNLDLQHPQLGAESALQRTKIEMVRTLPKP